MRLAGTAGIRRQCIVLVGAVGRASERLNPRIREKSGGSGCDGSARPGSGSRLNEWLEITGQPVGELQ